MVKLELEISKFKTRERVWLNIFNIVIKIMYRTTDADKIISSDLTLFLVMQNTVSLAITRKLRSCETSSYRKSRNKNSQITKKFGPSYKHWSLKSRNSQHAYAKVRVIANLRQRNTCNSRTDCILITLLVNCLGSTDFVMGLV